MSVINSLKAPYADMLGNERILAIRDSLEKHKLKQWGFVLIRCTYHSQEAWEKFLRLAKQDAYDYFEQRGMEESDVYTSMVWTVIEDANTLDGASVLDTSRRFEEWLRSEGRQEKQGSVFADTDIWSYYPRYPYFLHVDRESLESVVDSEKANSEGGYYCVMVRPENVLLNEGEEDDEDEDDEDEDTLLDQRKKVHVHELVEWYATLLNIDRWYDLVIDEDGGIADCP